jgi:hypothetical protein
MPLNTSIPLGVRQVKLDDPRDIRLKALALQGAEREQAAAARADHERKTIADLYRSSGSDSQAFERGLAESGLGAQIPGFRKQQAEYAKTQTEAEASKLKLAKDRLDAVNGGLASLLALPQVTHQDVITQMNSLVNAGVISPEQGAKAVRELPGPDQLRSFLLQQALQGADGAKRLESLLPKYNEQNRGGTINEGTIDPLTGQRTAGTDVQKTLTPGEIQSGKNAEILASAGGSVQTDANGNMLFVPNKVPQGQPVVPRPIVDAGGKQIEGRGLNDAQSKALLFGSRARDSAAIMANLEKSGTLTPSIVKQGAAKVPVVGGLLEMGANKTVASTGEQQLEQAQRDFVNAVLRRESGAVISPQEFENAQRQYFPAIGDTPEVIRQKAQNRELAIQGLLAEVPEGKRNSIGQQPTTPPHSGPRPPLDAFNRPGGQ